MIEPLLRASLPRLQAAYDRCPARARDLLASARGLSLSRIRYAPDTFVFLRALRADESWSAEQVNMFQVAALQAILDHACATVPFYADYPRLEISSPTDLRKLPLLTRETVHQRPNRFLSQSVPKWRRIRAGTTGTTGANLKIAYTEELARKNWAFQLRQWAWAGVGPREPRITLFGARIVPPSRTKPPYWTRNIPERQILMSIFHLSENTAPSYLDFLRTHQGKVLEGFPSVLSILADFVLRCGEPIPMRVVFTTGEPLYPSLRARIEKAFHSRVFDSYGMTEYCGLIQECEHGRMHLAPEYGFLEMLDEHDEPVAPGDEGYFVWTGFLNRAMPLIRYRIGDRGLWQKGGPCECGRAFPIVVPTITRESDILRCQDGRLFSPRALNQLLKHANSLRFCQFVHDRPGCVIVRVVAGNGHPEADVTCIRESLARLLGPSMQVIVEYAPEPLTRQGGKIPLIVDKA
jgi:phenylacetate-CoA ligase